MCWWTRTRQLPYLAIAVLLVVAITAAIGGAILPVPNLRAAGTPGVPLILFLPLVTVATASAGLANAPDVYERLGTRPIRAFDAALCAGTVGVTAIVHGLLAAAGTPAYAGAVTRNVAGYLGLALIAFRVFGRNAATVLPAGYAMVVAMLGRQPGGDLAFWAWPAQPATSVITGILATAFLVTGLGAYTLRSDRVRPSATAMGQF